MSLLDEARAAQKSTGSPCAISLLPDGLRAELFAALESDVDAQAISRALAKRNVNITGSVLRKHRANECRTCHS